AQAVGAVGIGSREDFYWTLHAVFVNRRDQREIFDQAFHVFWRNPRILERLMPMSLPQVVAPPEEDRRELSKRVADALKALNESDALNPQETIKTEIDAVMTFSEEEQLRRQDFEKMSAAELERAKRAIARLRLPVERRPIRRFELHHAGNRFDLRASLRRSLRGGGQDLEILRKRRRTRRPPLVILCDISGSMARYARMLLHFLHALTNDRDRVHTFLFGTRLTNVTRHLRYKDPDVALAKVGEVAEDWSGGTRIGASLHDFNRDWSRRVLAQGAVVLLISDGLDREGAKGLTREMERLHKSARRLVWLNPLLRYEGFEPKSSGIRAMLPHVDEFRPVHNLESLEQLAAALSRPSSRQEMRPWLNRLH
ncbi:MAG: vWA domain-containing protein, partial [Alphaproteobacteria bacterium]